MLESPDRLHRVEVIKSELKMKPFYRVEIATKLGRRAVLAKGFESMCGIGMGWQGNEAFKMRVPVPDADKVLMPFSVFDGVTINRETHEDFVFLQSGNVEGTLRLVAIRNCEGTEWNVYLRKAGEPNFNADMQKGWADPSVAGGFDLRRDLKSITWKGPRRAEILVQGNRGQVQTRDMVGGVYLSWKFLGGVNSNEKYKD